MRFKLILLTLICFALNNGETATAIPWKVIERIPKCRIDALADLGHGVLLIGTRDTNPALCFKSTDYGLTWKRLASLESTEKRVGITCIQSGANGLCYALNESSEFFRSVDYGATWQRITKLSIGLNTEGHALAYGLCITNRGTLLVSDANSSGGLIYRSTDHGVTFSQVKAFTSNGLYRFTLLKRSVIVNGWEGNVFCSKDDGQTWNKLAEVGQSPLYATETLGGNRYLQGTQDGNVYIGNAQTKSIKFLGKPGGAADDFAYVGYKTIIYSTYTEGQHIFISHDLGLSWNDEGKVPTGEKSDWVDHLIRLEKKDSAIVIGGTNKGFVVRASYSKRDLSRK